MQAVKTRGDSGLSVTVTDGVTVTINIVTATTVINIKTTGVELEGTF
jgi:hypothetical protein